MREKAYVCLLLSREKVFSRKGTSLFQGREPQKGKGKHG